MENRDLKIFNTKTKKKEVFTPKVPGKVGMYVCGVTPYDYSHIGHARAYVAFDVLYRYLKHLGYEVHYVRNFTDIDDKIINRAKKSGEDPLSLSRRFIQTFWDDMADLQCLPPDEEPRVSDHMDQIKDMIKKIVDNGFGYAIDGDVYFSVENFPSYGCLSGRKLDDNRAGGGGRVSSDELSKKRNPADFALWKSAKPDEPSWDSIWGKGRPGWHIECSAMSSFYLGHSFDIHGGGMDLVFPHHENELAQSCAACPESNVSYWVHNGFVNKDNEKMSKSLDNFFTIRDITAKYHPLALRYFLMHTHYRSDVNYSDRQLDMESDNVFYIYQALHDCEGALLPFREESIKIKPPANKQQFMVKFNESMLDDLHTKAVLDDLNGQLKAINDNLGSLKKKQKQKQQQQMKQQRPLIQALIALEKEVKDVLSILGLISSSTYAEVLQELKEKALKRSCLTEEYVLEQIEERRLARKNKEFAEADRIREQLNAKGIKLMDDSDETTWRPYALSVKESENANSDNPP